MVSSRLGYDAGGRISGVTNGNYSAGYTYLANSPLIGQVTADLETGRAQHRSAARSWRARLAANLTVSPGRIRLDLLQPLPIQAFAHLDAAPFPSQGPRRDHHPDDNDQELRPDEPAALHLLPGRQHPGVIACLSIQQRQPADPGDADGEHDQ
jgi:hypothetical protein